jgi:hypothetical protein
MPELGILRFGEVELPVKFSVARYRPAGAWYDTTYALPAARVIGDARAAVCQPELVSWVNVTRPRRVPVLVHKLPVWVPLFSGVL